MGRSDVSDEEIRQAIQRVGLDHLSNLFPRGCETPLEEAGSRFSGGEGLRIALGSYSPQSNPVVLLDEPTTGLERETELDLRYFRFLRIVP